MSPPVATMAGLEAAAAPRSAQDLFAPVTATVRVLAQVPRPAGDATVVPLDHITAGGLEAVQAEWSVDGGAVVLTGKAPFADLTGRAGFRSDGTLDGTVRMRARVGLLGLNLAEATWSVDGWTPGTPLAAPRITLRGAALAVDLRPLPAGTAWSASQGVNSARTERGAKIDLPKGVVPPGQMLSPRIVEVYRGLVNVNLSRLRVHTDAPAMEEGAPAPEVESAGTKPAVEPLTPTSAGLSEVPGTPAPAEAAKTEAGAAAPAVTDEPATERGEPGEEEAHAPRTPEEDPDFKQTVGKVGRTRKAQAAHALPTDKQEETSDASRLPEDQQRKVNDRDAHFDKIDKTAGESKKKDFTPEDFKVKLTKSIDNIRLPQTEDDAKEFKHRKPLEEAKQSIRGQVEEQKQNIVGSLANQVGVKQPPSSLKPVAKPGDLVEGKAGEKPTPISRVAAAPKPRLDNEISFEKESASLDELMAKNEMTEDQLAVSNERQFVHALGAKKEAQQKAAEAPGVYREGEQKVLEKARHRAERAGAKGFGRMFETREGAFTTVFSTQKSTADANTAEQVRIQAQLNDIYTKTKSDVHNTLEALTKTVDALFSFRMQLAKIIFESRVEDQLDDIYGWTRLDDAIFGEDKEAIKAVFDREKESFLKTMHEVIDQIAALIATSLNAAIVRIEAGRQEAKTLFDGLTKKQRGLSQEAYNVFQLQFDTLEDSVRAKEQELADTLAESYRSGVDSLQESFDKIKEDVSRSYIGKVVQFIEDAAEVIAKLGELLYSVLSRIGNVVGDILADPIRFIKKLASGVGAGFAQFMKNIDEYLVAGFFEWLRGSAGPAIKLPETLDAAGLFDLAAQILGLTYENFRKIAVTVWGKAAVELLETGAAAAEKGLEIVQIVREKRLAGLWDFIQASLSSLVEELIQNVKETVLFATIDKALAFIAGLFTPVGAFIEAALAIYRGIRFLMDNIDRISEIVDAFLTSVELAVAGNTDAIAQKIVNALRGFIVVGIDFLAKLLGLGDLAAKVHKILNAIKAPFERAVEAVLKGLTALVKAVMRKLGLGPRGEKEQPAQKTVEPGKPAAAELRRPVAEPKKPAVVEPGKPAAAELRRPVAEPKKPAVVEPGKPAAAELRRPVAEPKKPAVVEPGKPAAAELRRPVAEPKKPAVVEPGKPAAAELRRPVAEPKKPAVVEPGKPAAAELRRPVAEPKKPAVVEPGKPAAAELRRPVAEPKKPAVVEPGKPAAAELRRPVAEPKKPAVVEPGKPAAAELRRPVAEPKKPAAATPADKSAQVRKQAMVQLQQAASRGMTADQEAGVIADILNRLRGQGLERLELGPEEPDGTRLVSAAASQFLPLAKLVREQLKRSSVQIPPGRSVKLFSEVRFREPTEVVAQSLLATGLKGKPLMPGETGVGIRSAGAVLEQPESRTAVRLATWNTSNLNKEQNVSHAEYHFVIWLTGDETLMSRITTIMVNLEPFSPCSNCASDLKLLLKKIAKARGSAFKKDVGDAVLTWEKPYRWTTRSDVDDLISAGWKVHAPSVKEGDPLRETLIIVQPPNYKPPPLDKPADE